MHNFKRTILACSGFLITCIIISISLFEPYFYSELDYCNDINERNYYAGTIDTLFLGASHCLRNVMPKIVDVECGTSSYTIGGNLLSMHAREALLMEEIDRNPLKTVYLELSPDALQKDNRTNGLEGNTETIARLSTPKKRIRYLFKETAFNDFEKLYSTLLRRSFRYSFGRITGTYVSQIDYSDKGFFANTIQNDLTLSNADILSKHDSKSYNKNLNEENLITISRIVQECKKRNIELVLIVTPLSDNFIWQVKNWNDFEQDIKTICAENQIQCLDFNLMRSRYSVLQDSTCYNDDAHLSEYGASSFSKELGKIINMRNNGQNLNDLFYSTYDEMRNDSPYANYYRSVKK